MFTGLFPIWIIVIDWLLRLLVAAQIMLRKRPMPASRAWITLVLFVPFAGVFIYWLLGEARMSTRRAARYEQMTKGLEIKAVELWRARGWIAEHLSDVTAPVAKFGTAVSGMPAMRANTLTLLPENERVLDALMKDIEAAKHHIHMVYYIWMPDKRGKMIADALQRAAERGVEIRVLVDGVGSRLFLKNAICGEYCKKNVRFVEALPARLWHLPFSRLDLRNHRKIAVFDGTVAYCGSQNIHDVGFKGLKKRKARKVDPWVDATARVEGPAAQALAVTFLRDWQLDTEQTVESLEKYLPDMAVRESREAIVQVIPSGPGPSPQAIHQALLTTIFAARRELSITTPYFVPDDAMLEALTAAAVRGVRVTMIMPDKTDSPLVSAAGRSHYLELIEAGVKIYHYRGGLLHAKIVTADTDIGIIGSTNMDQRSFFLNYEVTLFAYDEKFTSELIGLQQDYLRKSREILVEELHKRRSWELLGDNAAQLVGPVL